MRDNDYNDYNESDADAGFADMLTDLGFFAAILFCAGVLAILMGGM
jgi:hypothetical protein